MPKTKIISTLGPASTGQSVLRQMALAGMDVVRLNFSHGKYEEHIERIRLVRRVAKNLKRDIPILQDLEGHRVRIGKLKNAKKPLVLHRQQELWVTNEDVRGTEREIPIDYHGSLEDIRKGQCIYIDDGKVALRVKKSGKSRLLTAVEVGGELIARKGINIPGAELKFSGLSDKDKADLEFGIKNRVNYIAQSFVRDRDDVMLVRNYIGNRLPGCRLIAKIESREGIENLDRILGACDGIMIARGDMGISLPVYEVPLRQKQIIYKCNRARKFVITATQMLESMVTNPVPTRAEVSDVANAIIDGTDFVMLSAETAVGEHPVETVDMMNRIIEFTERTCALAA